MMRLTRLLYVFIIVLLLSFIVKTRPAASDDNGNMQICDFIAHMNDTLESQAVTITYLRTLLIQDKSPAFEKMRPKLEKVIQTLEKQRLFYKKVHTANCSGLKPTDVVYSTTP